MRAWLDDAERHSGSYTVPITMVSDHLAHLQGIHSLGMARETVVTLGGKDIRACEFIRLGITPGTFIEEHFLWIKDGRDANGPLAELPGWSLSGRKCPISSFLGRR